MCYDAGQGAPAKTSTHDPPGCAVLRSSLDESLEWKTKHPARAGDWVVERDANAWHENNSSDEWRMRLEKRK
jgi:hypothetical protein